MIPILRSVVYLILATLITAPFGFLVTVSVVLPMRVRFWLISVWRAGYMAICRYVPGLH